VTSLTLAMVLQAAALTAHGETYAEAHRAAVDSGKPMLIMVSTEWCVPCQRMKKTVLPEVRRRGLFRKIAFAIVNPDREGPLAKKLTGGGPVPQLLMFRRTPEGWMRRKLVGGQDVATVEKFIEQGILVDATAGNTQPGDADHADTKHDAPKPTDDATQVVTVSRRSGGDAADKPGR